MAKYYVQYGNGEVYSLSFAPRLDDARIISRAEYLRLRPEYCRAQLLKMIKPRDTVYCVLRHCSSSGMQRRISLFVIVDGEIRNIDVLASDLMGYRMADRKEGIVVNGCGMDMGFHLVYSLGASLWTRGTDEPHGTRNGQPDSDGGYALKHVWL